MSDYGSVEPERVEVEEEIAEHRLTPGRQELLGDPEIRHPRNPREVKDWLASNGKGQLIYKLPEK